MDINLDTVSQASLDVLCWFSAIMRAKRNFLNNKEADFFKMLFY